MINEEDIPWIAEVIVEMNKKFPHLDVIDEDFVATIIERALGYGWSPNS